MLAPPVVRENLNSPLKTFLAMISAWTFLKALHHERLKSPRDF
jgi:hypothetical protein